MARRLVLIAVLAVLGGALSGCGPCGFDWRFPGTCRGEPAQQPK